MEDSQKINTDGNFKEIMSEFQTLSTFAGVIDWSKRTEDEIEKMAGMIRALDIEIAHNAQELERARYEHSQKPLFGRLFGGSSEDKEISQRIEQYRQDKSAFEKTVIQLQEAIDFTPKSPDEQKILVRELRQIKRQLQEKRREITTVIRGPRTEPQPAQAEPGFDPAAAKRRKVRYTRDAELRGQEITKEAMERQLAQVDSDILWVEKFVQ